MTRRPVAEPLAGKELIMLDEFSIRHHE